MSTENSSDKKLLGIGILTAFAASLCCITPILALISGASGIASVFSWMEPFRSYLIAVTLTVLGFAWYQKFKPVAASKIDCACDENGAITRKSEFLKSRRFLAVITAFAVPTLAFPYYSQFLYPKKINQMPAISSGKIQKIKFTVSGMTCSGCEEHVKHAVYQLPGIIEVKADYESGTTSIQYDHNQSDKTAIIKAIDATGYTVTEGTATQNSKPH
ncbi:mercuric ion transport protein [Pedobacter sp. CG_S7]|uniref:mercuric transport protein MerTP n=1 Tax=Pedobacter sp. CG_S7 TaxID=3143930 RepID=UPI003394FC16